MYRVASSQFVTAYVAFILEFFFGLTSLIGLDQGESLCAVDLSYLLFMVKIIPVCAEGVCVYEACTMQNEN